jgi:hypothetical protein
VETQKRKTTSIEQRAQQAIKGQEKLLLAKQRASEEMAVLAGRPFLPPEAVSFLSEVWVDKLVFVLLRHPQGDRGSEWREAVRIAHTLVSVFDPAQWAKDRRALEGRLPQLCDDIETELHSLGGRLPEAWQALATLLANPQSVALRAPSGERPVAQRYTGRQTGPAPAGVERAAGGSLRRQPGPYPAQAFPPRAVAKEPPITPREQKLIDEFRDLPFGTWLEFRSGDDGPPRRIKLSWFSPLTGTCMFVDNYGRKTETKPIRQVTADLMAGRARIIRQAKQPFFERALRAIQERLKSVERLAPTKPEVAREVQVGSRLV